MKTVRMPSPARSQGAGPRTPIRKHRRTLSVSSARSNASGRLTALIQKNRNMESFVISPLPSRRSVLSDNTEIEEPRRKSWWKNLADNSRDVIELLEDNKILEPNNIIEELDIEILSQEKKNYTMELPESSDSESINSIVIPQRKLFTQKENIPQKKFGQIIGSRETLSKQHKPDTTNVDKIINVPTRELFQNKQRTKPIFPAALLNVSPNKTTADKTSDLITVKAKPQIRNIFDNRGAKRKNIFTNFIVSESEDEIPEIQPKVFSFQKKIEARRRGSSSSRGIRDPSPTSSITTDIEMDDWKMLPSSTMVENQLEIMMADGNTPKKARLSKLPEIESDGSNATKQSNKSVPSKEPEKSRKSKTFTKDKALETSTTKNEIILDDEEQIFEQNEGVPNDFRKSKTFTKEKAPESESMATRNKSKTSQNNDVEEIFEQNADVQNKSAKDTDRSRKSKTFTKDKVHEESINAKNSSNILQNDDEMLYQNKSSKDTDKSRKSKTFTKEKANDFEASMSTRSKSKVSQKGEEISVQEKSKSQLADPDISHSSIKTRSQSMNSSPNKSQVFDAEPIAENNKKNKSKNAISPKDIEFKEIPPADEENDDDELNFTLEYENEDQQDEAMPDMHSQSNTKTIASKSMTQQENNVNLSKSNKTMVNKVVEESAELESIHEKSNHSLKVKNISLAINTSKKRDKMDINKEQTQQPHDASNKSNSKSKGEIEIDEALKESMDNQSIDAEDKIHVNSNEHVYDNDKIEVENNDESENQNISEVENNEESQEQIEDNEEQNDSQENDASENEEEQSHEVQDQNEPKNASQDLEDEVDNKSQEIEEEQTESALDKSHNEDVQNESHEEESENEDEEQNISQESQKSTEESDDERNESHEEESENEDEGQNISQESQKSTEESDDERNESHEVEAENDDEEQNISQNAQQLTEEQSESDAILDSDSENDELNNSHHDVANDSDDHNTDRIENNQDEEMESGLDENQEEIETPNVSHDTTGRHRKKNESPEVILDNINDHSESFAVLQGRNTSVRKTEIIKSINIRPSLAPVRESTGFSDGTRNSSAEGSGWDSHRTTRKTIRQTFGRDFSPRKSLRALVMEKSAKRQTQHNEMASVTAKFPQANSTELPEMSNRYDDEPDENQESNHEVSIRTRQTKLEEYLQEIKKKNTEARLKMEEAVRNSLNAPSKDHIFKVPAKPLFARRQMKATKPKQAKSTLFLGELPAEVIEDLKYKPPKRFQPSNAPWITKRLYKFLESKLEAKYDYKARVRAEKLVENIYHFAKELRRHDVASTDAVEVLKREMARLDVVKTHFEFYEFFHQFMPREVRVKVVPDVVNKISLPRHGVFSAIL